MFGAISCYVIEASTLKTAIFVFEITTPSIPSLKSHAGDPIPLTG
jgi:hypothetical protein